jgi:peroxiredoxin
MDEPLKLMDDAIDFSLVDTHDQSVALSDFIGRQNVVLVFNRGFG